MVKITSKFIRFNSLINSKPLFLGILISRKTNSGLFFSIARIASSTFLHLSSTTNLLGAVKKFEKKRAKAKEDNNLRLLIKNIDTGSTGYKNIAFPTESGFELIKLNSILYCVADNNYCKIVCLDGTKTTLSKSLKYVEESLPTDIFQRIHKSYLVNLNYISRFNKTNDLLVELNNGENLPVSIRKKEAFINAILDKK